MLPDVDVLRQLVVRAPADPVLLAGTIVAAWLPVCAVALLLLAGLAALQNYLYTRRRHVRVLVMPPADVRPLVVRRTITQQRHTNLVLDLTRLTLAIGAVLVFSALILASGAPMLLHLVR